MPRGRTSIETAAGKLISAIQKEWDSEIGTPAADLSLSVMDRGHELLQAAKKGQVSVRLGRHSVSDFLGVAWLELHPSVLPAVQALEVQLSSGQHA